MRGPNGHRVSIIGAGLAGCEAALWLARQGVRVDLYEQKPARYSPAHTSENLAELVCSNSLKAERQATAAGLLKAEMRLMDSHLLPVADQCRVPAGGALAVDRKAFASGVTSLVEESAAIALQRQEVTSLQPLLERGPVIVASGPLTQGALAEETTRLSGGAPLRFYDAAAPIVSAASVDTQKVFAASRYDRGEKDYLNCPFDKGGYEAFHEALLGAETAPLHDFEGPFVVYEGCMPIEVMARRGTDTLRYGPLRPVGLRDPRTGHRPWANVQLRREDAEGTLYNLVGFQTNLRFGEQQRVFRMIPGLENAEFVRYGVMHRNSFLDAPKVLEGSFALKGDRNLFFAGQITGFEGYMESAACGALAARSVLASMKGEAFFPPPPQTMCGALCAYMTAANRDYQPMGANMGLLPQLDEPIRDKKRRYEALAERALAAMKAWVNA
ncbi:methylenetetrahydrofolate--tRNA-(uracil(54)-C(5))-methyltransferase (FADH(2)-oxidizing) TrmFO [Ruminococcaceae bacterium OttesenSCG-928-I18]|nr:methylenetetrahydrofolate--tRNA-(uracil(54)-C(5))-methyltransferase (FADH(2)-oxidizing) TrmFO [Ruminococcaceae bacterium OttesenSCG-928-I18]